MIDVKSKEIGGEVYEVRPMPAIPGRRVFARLAKLLAPILETFARSGGKVDGAAVFAAAAAHVTEADMDFFCDAFAPYTTIAGANLQKIFTVHFVGKYSEMLEWLAFSVEVNFGDFFLGLKGKAAGPQPEGSAAST